MFHTTVADDDALVASPFMHRGHACQGMDRELQCPRRSVRRSKLFTLLITIIPHANYLPISLK